DPDIAGHSAAITAVGERAGTGLGQGIAGPAVEASGPGAIMAVAVDDQAPSGLVPDVVAERQVIREQSDWGRAPDADFRRAHGQVMTQAQSATREFNVAKPAAIIAAEDVGSVRDLEDPAAAIQRAGKVIGAAASQ